LEEKMASLFFYKNLVAIDKKKHKNYKIERNNNFEFAKNSISVLLTAVEFHESAREFPILFTKGENDKVIPAALLGLREAENLFVDQEMQWLGNYIPAFVRRYPFVFYKQGDTLTLCVDEDFPGFQKKTGEPLFLGEGEQSESLKQAMTFLVEYQAQFKRTELFIEQLVRLELLKDYNAKVSMNDGREFSIGGFMAVDEKKFQEISDEDLNTLFRSGDLGLIYAHLASLKNLQALVNRIPEKS